MQKRLNYTGRKRIQHSEVHISLSEDPGKPPRFEADLNLERLGLPEDAAIFVEAYYKSSSQRFECGTVGNFRVPANASLKDVDLGGQTLFRIKVVENPAVGNRLLASAEKIAPKDEGEDGGKDFLIKVQARNLGDITWRVDLDSDNKPELTLNNMIPDVIGTLTHNPVFQGLILPAVLREVLSAIYWDNDGRNDEEGAWQQQWLSFSERLSGYDTPDKDVESTAVRDWINNVVEVFCRTHKFRQRLVEKMEGALA